METPHQEFDGDQIVRAILNETMSGAAGDESQKGFPATPLAQLDVTREGRPKWGTKGAIRRESGDAPEYREHPMQTRSDTRGEAFMQRGVRYESQMSEDKNVRYKAQSSDSQDVRCEFPMSDAARQGVRRDAKSSDRDPQGASAFPTELQGPAMLAELYRAAKEAEKTQW